MQEYVTKAEASGFFQDVKDLFVQTERLLKESSLDTERLLKESSLDSEKRFQDSEKRFQETERLIKESSLETDRMIKEMRTSIGWLGDRLGEFVEEMVKPAAVRLFTARGLDVRQVFRGVTSYDAQGRFLMEVDLLVVDTDTAVAIECKSRCSVEDVAEHLDRLSRFKAHFPQYAAFHLYGAMASMVMPDDVARFAYRKGLYVMTQSGDTIQIRNDDQFKPREW